MGGKDEDKTDEEVDATGVRRFCELRHGDGCSWSVSWLVGKRYSLRGLLLYRYCKGLARVASLTCHRTSRTCHVAVVAVKSAMNPYSCCDKTLGGKRM